MILYVIRHGETKWNVERRLQGRSDVELNEYGIYLAEVTAEALKDVNFDVIYSSPLIRAYKTAEIIKGDRNINIITDDRLKEMSFGICEGRPSNEVPADFADFFAAPDKFKAMEGGESFQDVIARTASFIEDVVVPASDSISTMLVVAHGALNNALALNLLHRELKDYWAGVFPRNCSASIYDIEGHDFKCLEYGKIYYKEDEEHAQKLKYTPNQNMGGKE